MMKLNGGKQVAAVLKKENVKKIFCVPGESYLSVMDGLYDYPEIQLISTRHEGGAGFMAEGYAKSSGEVGVCMVTRGPGAANMSIAIHTAQQDSTPMVALIGQIERANKEKEAFQEVDLQAFFSHLCKWTVEITQTERIPELLHRAFHIARSGRPGPVVVSLPQDMLNEVAEYVELNSYHTNSPQTDTDSIKKVLTELKKAKRPFIIAGGGIIQSKATPQLVEFAEKLDIPVATAFRRFAAFPNSHSCYAGQLGVGTPELLDHLKKTDLIIALGTRLSNITTLGHKIPSKECRLIHVDISPDVFGKAHSPSIPITSDVKGFLEKILIEIAKDEFPSHKEYVSKINKEYLSFTTPTPDYSDDYVDMDGLMFDVIRNLPKDSIITSDAGNFFGWVSRYYRFDSENSYIGPTSGAMGYGLPAAIAAKLAHPNKTVVAFAGDGGFMMTLQELETAVRYQIPILVIVVNNNKYGTIQMHQQNTFPGRVIATELSNPDFAQIMELFGGVGERVDKNEDFVPALKRGISSGRPSLIELKTNPKIVSAFHEKKSEISI